MKNNTTPQKTRFASISLLIAGRRDGLRGLPRLSEAGDYTSPFLNRELHRYKTFCDQAWGALERELAEPFSRLGYLDVAIKRLSLDIERTTQKIIDAKSETVPIARKPGEDQLSEQQVQARRLRERAKQLQPLTSELEALESESRACIDEANQIRNELSEHHKAVRLACKRQMDLTRQRIDLYWHYALQTHPAAQDIPVIPSLKLVPDAELVFFHQHRSFLTDPETEISYLNLNYDVTNEEEAEP